MDTMKKTVFEEMNITYREENGYLIPNLAMPKQTGYPIGKYGRLRLDFIKKHRLGTYTTLLTEGRLNEHLHDIDEQVREQVNLLVEQAAEQIGLTENLKASDPLRWVQLMNNIKMNAEETVLREVIFR